MDYLARYLFCTYLILFTLGFTIYFTAYYIYFGYIEPTDLTIVFCTISLSIISAGMIKDEINEA